jgi:hypothetical protein
MMNTAHSGRQACQGSSPAVEHYGSTSVRALHFQSRLLTHTIAAFALATLTMFGFNAGLDYVTLGAPRAALAQQHAGLPVVAEKLADACRQGPPAALLATPAARCMAMAGMTMHHLLGVANASGWRERLGVAAAGAALNRLQKAVRRTAPARPGSGRRSRIFSLH